MNEKRRLYISLGTEKGRNNVASCCHEPHQVFIDEHGQLREGGVADLMLPMNLKAPQNTGKEPCDCFRKKIPPNNLERHSGCEGKSFEISD